MNYILDNRYSLSLIFSTSIFADIQNFFSLNTPPLIITKIELKTKLFSHCTHQLIYPYKLDSGYINPLTHSSF